MTDEELQVSEPLCADCLAHEGLCHKHERGVLPQLAQPFWYQLVGRTHFREKAPKESDAGRRIRERKARKTATRIARLVAGQFAPARSRAA